MPRLTIANPATIISIDAAFAALVLGWAGVSATTMAGPFNTLDAHFARGYFTGGHEGLAIIGSGSGASFIPAFVQGACGTSLSCSALTSVTVPADQTPTGNDSSDVFVPASRR